MMKDGHADTPFYYVPEYSRLPIIMAVALATFVGGFGLFLTARKAGDISWFEPAVWVFGFALIAFCMYRWFSVVMDENAKKMHGFEVKTSFVWGMGWFIFTEVMFFTAFFGALFYIRTLSIPWLSGEGAGALTHETLWPMFEAAWPLRELPDAAGFVESGGDMAFPLQESFGKTLGAVFGWLPIWNTIILISSSFTITVAHHGLREGNRTKLRNWLFITIALGVIFLFLQAFEYIHAYEDLGLTLNSGVYGSTFFMLTGFHGAHVTIGTIMLIVTFLRVQRGHFTPDDQFGFESTSWYWHFVDVVWVMLFLFVYIL